MTTCGATGKGGGILSTRAQAERTLAPSHCPLPSFRVPLVPEDGCRDQTLWDWERKSGSERNNRTIPLLPIPHTP